MLSKLISITGLSSIDWVLGKRLQEKGALTSNTALIQTTSCFRSTSLRNYLGTARVSSTLLTISAILRLFLAAHNRTALLVGAQQATSTLICIRTQHTQILTLDAIASPNIYRQLLWFGVRQMKRLSTRA